jgi:DNA-binding NarL/FixJ family response regulator
MTGNGSERRLRVHVSATDERVRSRVFALLGDTTIALASRPAAPGPAVLLSAAATVDEALAAWSPTSRPAGQGLVLAADSLPAAGVIRAVEAGVHVMIRLDRATPAQLADAVLAAFRGDGRLPAEVMAQLARAARPAPAMRRPGGPPRVPAVPATAAALTARQASVLALMADGHSNAAIARTLSCSEHTIKNVIYDLTARLQARNRAQAVAFAIRAGII